MSQATTNIVDSVERAAQQEGRILLTLDINYNSGIFYHEFDVVYQYYIPGLAVSSVGWAIQEVHGGARIVKLPLPAIIPLIEVIVGLLSLIVAYFLITSALKEIKEIVYGPPGTGGEGLTGTIFWGVILFGGAYFISKLVPAIREVRDIRKPATA
jgi:hypothetical protein